jgi:hypothetical protein
VEVRALAGSIVVLLVERMYLVQQVILQHWLIVQFLCLAEVAMAAPVPQTPVPVLMVAAAELSIVATPPP